MSASCSLLVGREIDLFLSCRLRPVLAPRNTLLAVVLCSSWPPRLRGCRSSTLAELIAISPLWFVLYLANWSMCTESFALVKYFPEFTVKEKGPWAFSEPASRRALSSIIMEDDDMRLHAKVALDLLQFQQVEDRPILANVVFVQVAAAALAHTALHLVLQCGDNLL